MNEILQGFIGLASVCPDLKFVENIYAMVSSNIYNQGSLKNLGELGSLIYVSVLRFNETRAAEVLELYNPMPSRLCSVLEIHGKKNILLADWHLWNMFLTVRIIMSWAYIFYEHVIFVQI